MTEYDFSPEAWDRYMETQNRIRDWCNEARRQPPCNAFEPSTPHLEFLELTDKEEREKRHRQDPRYSYAQSKKVPPRPSPRKDRRYSYDQYARQDVDKKYRSDTEEEDYAAKSKSRTRRHRDSQTSVSHVSAVSRHHERSSSRQESHVSSRDMREEKYRSATPARERELSTSSRERDRSDSEFRSSSRASATTPASSRSQSRQGNVISAGQGYVVVETDRPKSRTTHNTPTATRPTTPTSAKVPSSRRRAVSHAAPTSAGVTPKPIPPSTTVPPVPIITKPATRSRATSRSQVSPVLTLDLPPFGQPHVIGNDYAGYPVSRPSAAVYAYPQQQVAPTSAPPLTRNATNPTPPTYNPATFAPKPTRSQTTPGYDGRSSYGNTSPWQDNLSTHPLSGTISPNRGSTSLLKRMFTGLTLGKASGRSSPKFSVPKERQDPVGQSPQVRKIHRKRSSSF